MKFIKPKKFRIHWNVSEISRSSENFGRFWKILKLQDFKSFLELHKVLKNSKKLENFERFKNWKIFKNTKQVSSEIKCPKKLNSLKE